MQMTSTMPTEANRNGWRRLFDLNVWGHILFWTWNAIFLVFVLAGFTPFVLVTLFEALRGGLVPPIFFVTAAAITFVPVASVALGLLKFRSSGRRLLAFGYGVEAPLMLILLFRLFGVREATPAVTMLVIVAALGILTLLWLLLDEEIDARGSALTHLRTLGATLLLLMGLYAGVWLAFYAVPLAFELLRGIATFISDVFRGFPNMRVQEFLLMGLSVLWFMALSLVFGALTATLFVGMPVALVVLAVRAWKHSAQTLAARHGWARPVLVAGATVIVSAVAFGVLNQQPQRAAYALLQHPPASLAEARSRMAQQEAIRAGLVNAYLAPFRYTSAVGHVTHIKEIYQRSLGLDENNAVGVQRAYEWVSRPFLYEPSGMISPTVTASVPWERWDGSILRVEPQEAARLYQQFFDQPINQGERETIINAARSTWAVDQAQAAWQAVDEREVRIVSQDINVTEHGDWAEVELYEVYQNETAQREEVVYYFSLPESAVVTGVWLGNSADRSQRFTHRVSPRGAAQQIYKEEVVVRRVDPALLEQIGPRQYRLRAFPIEPRTLRWDEQQRTSTAQAGDTLHLWLTWRTLAKDNAWPMPQLTDKRNVYWDGRTTRTLNGKPIVLGEREWMPANVPANTPIERVTRVVAFADGQVVTMTPMDADTLPALPDGMRVAIVLDRSRSMAARADDVRAAIAQLKQVKFGAADVYLTASAWRGEGPSKTTLVQLDAKAVEYIGGQRASDLLTQFEQLRGGAAYDAILVLTDGSGYEEGEPTAKPSPPDAPLWMVHLGGTMSYGYDDAMLEAIQASGGGAANNLDEALSRIAIARVQAQSQSQTGLHDWSDGYEWKVISADEATGVNTIGADDPFAAIAARRLILSEMRRNHDRLAILDTLDQLHTLAKQQSIVTPFSSMIVLVNERQQDRLDALEKGADRFQREVEGVGQTQMDVTAVPEPHEWLLMGLAATVLGAWWWRRKTLSLHGRR